MRYVVVPPTLNVTNPATKESRDVTFKEFLKEMLATEPQFTKSYKNITIAVDLEKAIDKANGVMALENEHWSLLRKVLEEPAGGYAPGVGIQIRSYIEAVIHATPEAPEPGASLPESTTDKLGVPPTPKM